VSDERHDEQRHDGAHKQHEPVTGTARVRDDEHGDGDELSHEPLGDLHDDDEMDLSPEHAVVDSLQSALKQLRDDADRLAQAPLDDDKVAAAERLAEQAAALDEQIGSIARKDEG
jgi:hypothetical protein